MAAPAGNNNAGKNKPFQQALKRAIARRDENAKQSGATLIGLANQLLDAANNGEQWAFQELLNRLDGRPAQQQVLTGPDDGAITIQVIRLANDSAAE